eukprot:TRINITY_DN66040_c7_g2_i2.p1 TRINITY_DN66040_c7_g2~~TRINITY_DN66040_c7_g2_i2.p1  ORF type:complete len:544 (+),score=303.49 TRINITY_DN66040_c7_g2_i2:38-1669(+)
MRSLGWFRSSLGVNNDGGGGGGGGTGGSSQTDGLVVWHAEEVCLFRCGSALLAYSVVFSREHGKLMEVHHLFVPRYQSAKPPSRVQSDDDEEEDDDEDDENATGDSPNKKTTVATTTTSIKPSSGTNSPLARARALAEEDDAAARRPERRQSLAQILAEEHGTHDDLHHLEPTITPADAQPKQPSPGQSGGRSLRDRQQGDDNDEVKQDGTPAPLISPASRNRLRMSSSRHKLNKDPTQSTSGKADDQMIFIGMLRAGGPRVSFGELGLIHNARRSATIMTGSTQSDFLTVDKTAFDRVLKARYAEDLEAKVQQLKQIELFAGMSDEHLSKIALHLQKRIVGPKQDLIKAGSKPNHIFFITKGCVEVREHVSASSPSSSRGSGGGGLDEVKQQAHSPLERPTSANAANRKRQSLRALRSTSKDTYRTIEVLKAGNIFGEHCLSTPPMPQPHDVRSLTETELIVLDKQDFLRRVKGDLVQKVLDDTQLRHKKIKEKMNQGSGDGQSQTLPSPSGRLHVDAVAAARTAAMAASDHVTSEPTTPIY